MDKARRTLFEIRQQRIAPGLDDKVLVSWNGLMIDSLARAAGVLDRPRYREAAVAAAEFLWQNLRRADGRLLHTWRNGRARWDAYLDDYAALLNGLVSLYEATFDEQYVDRALELAEILIAYFLDPEEGGFFYTATDHEPLIARQKEMTDSAVPSGNGLAATGLFRLGKLTGRQQLTQTAVDTLQAAAAPMKKFPSATGQLLLALEFHLGPTYEMVLIGDPHSSETSDLVAQMRQRFLPPHVLACRSPGSTTFQSLALNQIFQSKEQPPALPALYICQQFTCQQPATGLKAARAALARLPGAKSAE